jgi:hypothetical protein
MADGTTPPCVPFKCCCCEEDSAASPSGTCASCQGTSAQSWLCKICFKTHLRGNYPSHTAVVFGEEHPSVAVLRPFKLSPTSLACQVHLGQVCGLQCTECESRPLICVMCIPEHRTHAFRALPDLALVAKTVIAEAISAPTSDTTAAPHSSGVASVNSSGEEDGAPFIAHARGVAEKAAAALRSLPSNAEEALLEIRRIKDAMFVSNVQC